MRKRVDVPDLHPTILPPRWREAAFIAGGYAVDQDRASDVDVWVTVPEAQSLSLVRDEILAWLNDEVFDFTEQKDHQYDENVELATSYPMTLENYKVAMVTGQAGVEFVRPIHIIVTNGDVFEVLEGFDISTHQAAVTNPFENPTFVPGPNFTPTNVEPVILKDTPHTRNRFIRIARRYESLRA